MADDKATLKLQIEKELRERIEATAEKEGLSVSAWVRRTLLCHFNAQDNPKKEEAPVRLAVVTPSSPATQTLQAAEAIQSAQVALNMHSCAYLNTTLPPGWHATECQGTCEHPRQRGHRCTWGSNVAKNCSAYRPKKFEFPMMGKRRP